MTDSKKVPPRQFRLDNETLAILDRIALHLGQRVAGKPNRAAAIRWAVELAEKKIPKKSAE